MTGKTRGLPMHMVDLKQHFLIADKKKLSFTLRALEYIQNQMRKLKAKYKVDK